MPVDELEVYKELVLREIDAYMNRLLDTRTIIKRSRTIEEIRDNLEIHVVALENIRKEHQGQ